MTTAIWVLPALLLAIFPISAAGADEKDFLENLSGSWSGSGQVRLRPDSTPVTGLLQP